MKESELTRAVIELAQLLGWKVMHIRPAQNARGDYRTPIAGDGKGWPDLFMVKPDSELAPYAIELKVGKNKPTAEQLEWIYALGGAGCYVGVWTDRDWTSGHIERELKGGKE